MYQQKKYLKYKQKYLELRFQKGGSNNVWKDKLELNTGKFIDGLISKGGKPIYTLSEKDARQVLDNLQEDSTYNPPVEIKDVEILDDNGKNISIRIIYPKNKSEKFPVVMFYHGGGWILGDEKTHHRLVCELSLGSNSAVVFVKYTPSPEAKFPVPIEQAYSALKYISNKGQAINDKYKLNLDYSKIIVAGDSVGGNMATVVALLAKERKGPKILYQILFYPVTDARMNTISYSDYAEGPWLTKKAMEWFFNAYAPNINERNNYKISPLQATLDQLKGSPPALIITDENDVLRDEGEQYAHKLMQAGVEVTAVRYLGTHHDFVMLKPLLNTPATRSAIELAIINIKRIFGNK